MRPELVIFDCDGVLVDSETVSNQVMVDNLARYGLTLTLGEAMDLFVGGTMRGVAEKAQGLGADLPGDWMNEIYDEIYAALRAGTDVISGVPDLLDWLDAEGIPYAVASNGSDEKMDITLGQTGLAPRFEGRRFSAQTLGVAKPDPGLFLAAAGDVPADACVVIEDSATGADAARRAGMRCLGYVPEGDGTRLAAFGAELFRSMGEVPGRLMA